MSSRGSLVRLSVSRIAVCVLSLPLFSFIFCVVYSLTHNFKASTETHCKVANVLPSISASIGSFSPQNYVWRAGIGLHSAPRFLYAYMYLNLHRRQLPAKYVYLAYLAFLLEVIEDSSLLGLSMVSSSENYPIHEKCFLTFLGISILYMALCGFVIPRLQHRRGRFHLKSLAIKQRACWITLLSTLICGYTFYRHNSHCEPYMYTFFAFAEYVIVLCNIAFHGTAFYDFHGTKFVALSIDEDSTQLLKRTDSSD